MCNKIPGIYKIQSKVKPDRCYIGSAVNIHKRWLHHLQDLRRNKHHSKKLQRHFNKYGEVDLQFSILLGCKNEDLLKTEQYFLDSYLPYFNGCKIAGSTLGMKLSKDHRIKLSEAHKGKHSWNKGKSWPEETRKKIGESQKGRVSNRKGLKGWITHTEETRRKMSESAKGKVLSEETKRLISESRKNMSDETRQKMRLAATARELLKKEKLILSKN